MFVLRRKKIKEKIISADEKILVEFGVAKAYANFWIFLGMVILFISLIFIKELWLAILLGLSLLAYGFYLKAAYFYFLTDKRIICYYQFLRTELTSIDYQKITDVNVKENFLEKIFLNSGSLAINTAGTPKEEIVFTHLAAPHLLKKKLDEIKSAGLEK